MRVLVACEFSGVVRQAFVDRGHDAWSCDVVSSIYKVDVERHIKGDVRQHLRKRWDLVIAHPPCTYLTRAGAPQLKRDPTRADKMVLGARFFAACLAANAERVAVENPPPFKAAVAIIGKTYDQVVHPYMFGHPESKPTCLWLKNLPPLVATDLREPQRTFAGNRLPPSPWRGHLRSITFQGLADAMAEQWGSL